MAAIPFDDLDLIVPVDCDIPSDDREMGNRGVEGDASRRPFANPGMRFPAKPTLVRLLYSVK
jgi:hypothetical protein